MCSKTVGEGNPKSSAANINHPGKAIDTPLVTSPYTHYTQKKYVITITIMIIAMLQVFCHPGCPARCL
jgi:hypothetical protein